MTDRAGSEGDVVEPRVLFCFRRRLNDKNSAAPRRTEPVSARNDKIDRGHTQRHESDTAIGRRRLTDKRRPAGASNRARDVDSKYVVYILGYIHAAAVA